MSKYLLSRRYCSTARKPDSNYSSGFGDPLEKMLFAPSAMLIRINSLLTKVILAFSLSTVEKLLELLNKGVTPYIPEKALLGASGD